MLNVRQEQIGCARPIGPHREIQLVGKSTADNTPIIMRKETKIYKRNLTLEEDVARARRSSRKPRSIVCCSKINADAIKAVIKN